MGQPTLDWEVFTCRLNWTPLGVAAINLIRTPIAFNVLPGLVSALPEGKYTFDERV
jgi:hypothetical protein